MKNIYIFCDGGFGNRIFCLIGGILTSKLLEYNPIIVWPKTNWCNCSFEQLFETDFEIQEKKIDEIFFEGLNDVFLLHQNFSKFHLENHYSHSLENIELIKNVNKNVYYTHHSIPNYFKDEDILSVLENLKIKKSILEIVDRFSIENNLNQLKGLHFRKTDSSINNNELSFLNIVQKKENNFFICSDDPLTEELFLNNSNVIRFEKKEYVKKFYENKEWNSSFKTESGHIFNYNVNRSETSVIEAFIDLLLLSKTDIITNTTSSFLGLAKYYNKLNKK